MSAKKERPMTESPPTTPPRMEPRCWGEDDPEPEPEPMPVELLPVGE